MFTWVPFFTELAKSILAFRDRQPDLIKIISELASSDLPLGRTSDKGVNGEDIPLREIDPFTFYASFNRNLRIGNKQRILTHIKACLNLQAEVPSDFEGVPTAESRNAWYFQYAPQRNRALSSRSL